LTASRLPAAPHAPAATGIAADALRRRVDDFLGTRGFRADSGPPGPVVHPARPSSPASNGTANPGANVLDFVCEEDVRLAIQAGQKLVVAERAIITPAARDLAEQHRVITIAPWRGQIGG